MQPQVRYIKKKQTQETFGSSNLQLLAKLLDLEDGKHFNLLHRMQKQNNLLCGFIIFNFLT